MADEARLNQLLDLVEQARSEGDTATEQKAIAAYKRESTPTVDASPAGAGGYNPFLGRLAAGVPAVGAQLGMTPQNTANPIANAAGPLETLLQAGTGTGGAVAGGLAGLLQGGWNAAVPRSMEGPQAADRVRQVQEALTYQPRTGMGAGFSRTVNAPFEAYGAGTNYVGEKVTDVTGSPAAGAFIKTAGDIAPGLIGVRGAKTGQRQTGEYKSTKFDVPTTEQLRAAAGEAYKAADEAGVIVPVDGYVKALDKVRTMAKREGIDPTLHPGSTAVMKRLEESAGKPLTLQEAETLRKIALDAEDSLNPVTREATPDARLAGKIVDELDDSIDALSVNSPARALWSRSKRSQMIDRAIARAEVKAGAHYTQAGMEHAIRQEFKQLALNDRRMRGLTEEQRAAIKKVAAGGPLENSIRALGKFDPTTSPVAAASSLGTTALLTMLNPAAALLPAAGFLGKRAATSMTKRNVDAARESLVGAGVNKPPQSVNIPDRAVAGELMPREPLALPAPNIISGQRSAPGTAYAREQMGLTPDVEQAGLLHPGMARESVRRPPALPHLPAEAPAVSPMVVDPSGRVAPSAASLDDYLRTTGQLELRKTRRGLLDNSPRAVKDIQADIRRLSERVRDIATEPSSSPRVRELFAEIESLQRELSASQASR